MRIHYQYAYRGASARLAIWVCFLPLLFSASCVGQPPSARATRGKPAAVGTASRSHNHVHLPGEVQGARLYPVFVRAIRVPLYANERWVVPPSAADSIGRALASLRPTLVSGLFVFAPEELPTVEHRQALESIRQLVRAEVPEARFDIGLDAMAYDNGNAVVQHMRELDESLEPDLWTFDRWDRADRERFAVVVSAVGHAHANGRAIGGFTTSREVPQDSDFGIIREGEQGALQRRLSMLSALHPIPYLVLRTDTLSRLPAGGGARAFNVWPVQTAANRHGFSLSVISSRLDREFLK